MDISRGWMPKGAKRMRKREWPMPKSCFKTYCNNMHKAVTVETECGEGVRLAKMASISLRMLIV